MANVMETWLPEEKIAIAVLFSVTVNHFAIKTDALGMRNPESEKAL
jgi:hypothetical protein